MIQCLGLQVSTVGGVGFIPGCGTKTPQASGHSQKKKECIWIIQLIYTCFGGMFSIQTRQSEDVIVPTPPSGMCGTDRPALCVEGGLLFLSCCYFYLFARILQCEDDVKGKLPVTLQL